MTKEQALYIHILILSILRWDKNPTKVVAQGRKEYFKAMGNAWLRKTGENEVRRIGKRLAVYPKVQADPIYDKINRETIEFWDKARANVIKGNEGMFYYESEVIQVLFDRLTGSKYQSDYIGIKRMESILESLRNASKDDKEKPTEEEIVEALNNSRKLAEEFLKLAGIKKRTNLATRIKTMQLNKVYK